MKRYFRFLMKLFLGTLVIIAILIVTIVIFVITMSSSDQIDKDRREVGEVTISSEASSEYIAYTGPITEEGLNAAANKYSDAELLNIYSEIFKKYSAKIRAEFPEVTYEEYSAHFITMLRKNEVSVKGAMFDDSDLSKVYEFYANIDVNPMIGNYGFLQINDSMEELPQAFYYSLTDLENMGVHNIILRDGVWEPDYSFPIFRVDSKYVLR